MKEIFSNSVWILSSSGGQKARVVFAELACRQPDVLILVSIVRSFALPRDEHFLLSCWLIASRLTGRTYQQFGHWVNRCFIRGHQWIQRRWDWLLGQFSRDDYSNCLSAHIIHTSISNAWSNVLDGKHYCGTIKKFFIYPIFGKYFYFKWLHPSVYSWLGQNLSKWYGCACLY